MLRPGRHVHAGEHLGLLVALTVRPRPRNGDPIENQRRAVFDPDSVAILPFPFELRCDGRSNRTSPASLQPSESTNAVGFRFLTVDAQPVT